MIKTVIKRDERKRKWNPTKVISAMKNAIVAASETYTDDQIDQMAEQVEDKAEALLGEKKKKSIHVEEIQDIVEHVLMDNGFYDSAKAFILYRETRSRARDVNSGVYKVIRDLSEATIASSNTLRDNANENGATPAGLYGKIASETNKMYNLLNVVNRKYAKEHKDGHMHIHDLNQNNLTFNCLQAPIGKLLSGGFDSGTGFLRHANRIESAAQLTAVIMQLQSNQQFGGIASDNLDFDLAPFVDISFKKNLAAELVRDRVYNGILPESILDDTEAFEEALDKVYKEEVIPSHVSMNQPYNQIIKKYNYKFVKTAMRQTDHDTFEGMEGLVANLNSLQSRSGNQVPFSSINFGLDTSKCGRMVSSNLIKAQYAGLGDGLTAIFPILIFKLMKGYTYNKEDPNYDLYLESIKCLARRFYPNFVSCDATFNKPYVKYDTKEIDVEDTQVSAKKRGTNDEFTINMPYRMGEFTEYEYEVETGSYWEIVSFADHKLKVRKLIQNTTIAAMGCRTRVIGNINGPEQTTGRGNFAFHTLNLPRLAIEAHIETTDYKERKKLFFSKLDAMLEDAKGSLLDRFALISKKTYENYPFTMQQGLYLTSDDKPHALTDTIGEVLKQSTLSIGYVGIAETMMLLTGKKHGIDHEIDDYALSIVRHIYDFCKQCQFETHLNWSCFATPAESTAGRFASIDKKLFENEKKLDDVDKYRLFGKGYYTNSHMMDFSLPTSLENKIKTEAPYHAITNAGHIFYYKLNGDLSKNLSAVKAAIDAMYEGNLGYFTVTMDSDTCLKCKFHGIIDNACPCCGETNENYFVRVRRITGYLTGSPRKSITQSWCDGKKAELPDRSNI